MGALTPIESAMPSRLRLPFCYTDYGTSVPIFEKGRGNLWLKLDTKNE